MASELFMLSSPAERAQELVRFIRNNARDSDITPLAEAAASGDFAKLFEIIFHQHNTAFRSCSTEDLEGAFTIVFSLISALPEAARQSVVQQIASAATASTDSKTSATRIRILVNLYNSAASVSAKVEVLGKLVQYASDTKHLDALMPFFATASTWKTTWGLSSQQAAGLFLLISESLEAAGLLEDAQVFLLRHLQAFETESADVRKTALPAAKKAALNFIRAPAVSQRSNLPSLAVVRDMASHPDLARLHQLVDIFSHKTLDAYLAYEAAQGQYLKELGVDQAASMETMRLLTLCTLAASAETLSYDAVAQALKINVADVEGWVVRAVSSGLIDARMDQQSHSLSILRTVQREFSAGQWKELQKKLHAWRDSVASMSNTLERKA